MYFYFYSYTSQSSFVNPISMPPTSSEAATPQSFPLGTPRAPPLIPDTDLIRCTRHIHGNVSILAGSLGITSEHLEKIEQDYREVETQAYWVLKKWQENHPNMAHQDLHDTLQALEFDKAAERYHCLYMNL